MMTNIRIEDIECPKCGRILTAFITVETIKFKNGREVMIEDNRNLRCPYCGSPMIEKNLLERLRRVNKIVKR